MCHYFCTCAILLQFYACVIIYIMSHMIAWAETEKHCDYHVCNYKLIHVYNMLLMCYYMDIRDTFKVGLVQSVTFSE